MMVKARSWLMLYFLLMEEEEEKERKRKEKKIAMGEEGFPGTGPTLLAVQ
jgi:hypothetical protein